MDTGVSIRATQPAAACPSCGRETPEAELAEARNYAFWRQPDGACPACVQQHLLTTLLTRGHAALHEAIQTAWPLDAEAAFGALPTPLRMHADPRFAGRGVTLALIDSGFYPHPDLVSPRNRIRAWINAAEDPLRVIDFTAGQPPRWPQWDGAHHWQWHGLMTSVAAAGNGFLSRGLYRGLASEADLVLIQVRDAAGGITNDSITRALRWLAHHGAQLGVRVVSMSVSGDPVEPLAGNPLDEAVATLVRQGLCVVAAAGNSGERRLLPPATAPFALTVGGLDDRNTFDHAALALWHSNYGEAGNRVPKPELVAPSIWVAAPLLPATVAAQEAAELFDRRRRGDTSVEGRIAERKLITPHYQHVEGTSFAAPIAASAICCMLEANPALTPLLVRDALIATAHAVPGAPPERQGAGVLDAGRAVARALAERHGREAAGHLSPRVTPQGVIFNLHDHAAQKVEAFGSWSGWREPLPLQQVEPGAWQSPCTALPPGRHQYKFLLDGARWLDDPANPQKFPDGLGGLNSLLVT